MEMVLLIQAKGEIRIRTFQGNLTLNELEAFIFFNFPYCFTCLLELLLHILHEPMLGIDLSSL